ncbi:hypothetical protein HDV64DRAFT_248425 [Trichoderma sp. TUCIM 5745]
MHSMRVTPQNSRIQDAAIRHYTENKVATTFVSREAATMPRVPPTEHKFPQSAAKQAINRRNVGRRLLQTIATAEAQCVMRFYVGYQGLQITPVV